MMKTTRHSLLAKGIMVLLSLLILFFAFSYSWLSNNPQSKAEGITFSAKAEGDFEYAIGFYNSGTENQYAVTQFTKETTALDLKHLNATVDGGETYTEYDLLHDYEPIDLTGDGPTLIRPSMTHGNTAINTASGDYSLAIPNKQYINFDLYFRSTTSGVPIYLAKGSYAQAACETVLGNISSRSTVNKSTYGSFSKDAIVGAARIAFIPYSYEEGEEPEDLAGFQSLSGDQNSASSWVWLPRPDIHTNATNTTTGWTLSYGTYPNAVATPTYSDSSVTADNVHGYYNIFNETNQIVTATNTILPTTLNTANQQMCSIGGNFHYGSGTSDDPAYYYTKVNVRIWIEGTDAQARRAFAGGQFAVNFKFSTKEN